MNPAVDLYLKEGCGRCPLWKTPQCKTLWWQKELVALRSILLETELVEELKWKVPTYTWQGKNILVLAAFKEFCSLNFFKGALMKDPKGMLTSPGENSQAARYAKFTSKKDITKAKNAIKQYVLEAIELEKSGKKIAFKKISEYKIPEELTAAFKKDAALKKAFQALTPGRQRGYLIHFAQPKQAATRIARIEKCRGKILEGKGFFDYGD